MVFFSTSVTGFQVDLACVVIFIVCVFYTSIVSRPYIRTILEFWEKERFLSNSLLPKFQARKHD